MVGEFRLQRRALLGVCMLFWAASGCAGLYFYAHNYYSWAANVILFQNTTISKRNGWLQLNPYANFTFGRALYKSRFQIQNTLNNSVASFNTSFIFSMNTDRGKAFFGDGLAFLICPDSFLNDNLQVSSGGYLGMFNASTNGLADNRIFAIEFDTHQNPPFHDPNDNHIGIDINSVTSLRTNDLSSLGIILNEGRKIICWIDYDGGNRHIWVYLAYSPSTKPSSPLIAMDLDLAHYMQNNAYVGFTSATGQRAELHTIYSWWFLTGFGNLTLPTATSSQPLESLGRRSVVISVFTLAIAPGFLCLFCILARRRWQEKLQHLIDVLLPVACWMYWKESITQEVRLKLAKPTIELLAWLWRTRWARRQTQPPRVKTWRQMLFNIKMGPSQKRQAWQLEDRKQPQSAIKGPAELVDKTTSIQPKQTAKDARPKAAPKGVKLKAAPDKKVKEIGKKQKKPPHIVAKRTEPAPLLVAATEHDLESSETQGNFFEPRLKNFRISNASFILMDEESRTKLADMSVVNSSGGKSQLEEAGVSTPSSAHSEGPARFMRETVTVDDTADSLSERMRVSMKLAEGKKALEDGGKDLASMPVEGAMPQKVKEFPLHPSSSAESGSEPHATQSWLID
ncbi:hypothetical protein GOP47_0022544 [Adiantum capillus-veneris]|uniref:Legume lectin domain-containing protein n=1 Tax=Adiantum capillus-veneris TaxID=13818 RepID=A0A9D4Z5L8_ADICA|nr:hypothetical protein GOP47_0022544 [Adiantum capillus-veneris]